MKIRFILLIYLVVQGSTSSELLSQKENNKWILGVNIYNMDSSQLDTGFYNNYGINVMDFNYNPFTTQRNFKSLSIANCVVNMCDESGDLLFYSNGSKIFNKSHHLMENGDSLNFGRDWTETDADTSYFASYRKGFYSESVVVIKNPSNSNQYYFISVNLNFETSTFDKLVYSIIDISKNNGLGKVILKEKLITFGNFSQSIAACKKANGTDWWILARKYETNCYMKLSLDKTGIKIQEDECIGYNLSLKNPDSLNYCVSSKFSHDGNRYASYSYKGIELYEFNRCTGKLSNRKHTPYSMDFDTTSIYIVRPESEICFSPNSKLLYALNYKEIYQYDVDTSDFQRSKKIVAIYDGFNDPTNPNDPSDTIWKTHFVSLNIAPDSKIYINSNFATRYLTVIENPNVKGSLCNVKQHSVKLKTYALGVPHYPNYSLVKDSSSCKSGIVHNELESIMIYPNPVRKILYISYVSASSVFSMIKNSNQIQITNILGQNIPINIEYENDKIKIDVSSMHQGLYIISLQDKNGVYVINKKIAIEQ